MGTPPGCMGMGYPLIPWGTCRKYKITMESTNNGHTWYKEFHPSFRRILTERCTWVGQSPSHLTNSQTIYNYRLKTTYVTTRSWEYSIYSNSQDHSEENQTAPYWEHYHSKEETTWPRLENKDWGLQMHLLLEMPAVAVVVVQLGWRKASSHAVVAAAAAGPVLEGLPLDGGGIPQEEDRKPIREYIYKGAIMSLHGTSTARVLDRI